MAIAFDAASPANSLIQGFPGNTSLTYSHTVGAGLTNGILIVNPGWNSTLSNSATNVTYAAAGCTHLGSSSVEVHDTVNLFFEGTDIWRKLSPASGANNVVITMSGTARVIFGGSTSWSGVDQTTPLGTPVTNTGNSASATASSITSATGEVVVGSLQSSDNGPTDWTSSDTQRWKNDDQNQFGSNEVGSSKAGAATVTLTWTGGSNFWAVTGASMKVASSATFNPGWAYGATKTIGGVF